MMRLKYWRHYHAEIPAPSYLEFFLTMFSEAAALAAFLAIGLITLFGLNAFRILNAAHAVPKACPAASSPSLVALPACSPYLQNIFVQNSHS